MFDLSWLSKAELQFVVIADTHYLRASTPGVSEFASRRKQPLRARVAMEQAATLPADFAIHLGDVAQEYAGSPNFGSALDEALAMMREIGFHPRHVAGNQDVGDKPDPTAPAAEVTAESMALFEQRVGPTWQSFDSKGWHITIVNSQILNTALPAAIEQRAWLERDLAQARGRKMLFLHLPLFLHDPDEPHFGHYDNLGQGDRRWLLDLIERHGVEMTFSGHVHWRFYNRRGKTRIMTMASPAFTRPGFSYAFTSAPPSEQGRNDEAKLSFFLIRICDGQPHIHLMRTEGRTEQPPDLNDGWRYLVTRTPAGLPDSPVGVIVREQPAPVRDVPRAWPSVRPQRVRNDYLMLGCYEMGVRRIQVDWLDTVDEVQRRQLHKIREDGVAIRAEMLWADDAVRQWTPDADLVDAVEIRLIGGEISAEAVDFARQCTARGIEVTFSPLDPLWLVTGKQHRRTRYTWLPEELQHAAEQLAATDAPAVRLPISAPGEDIASIFKTASTAKARSRDAIDVVVTLDSTDDALLAWRAAQAAAAIACLPEAQLYFDPLSDMDRTMDATHGLLDTQSNPRPAFHVLRCLNTLLFAEPGNWRWVESASSHSICIASQDKTLILRDGMAFNDPAQPQITGRFNGSIAVCRLVSGLVRQFTDWESMTQCVHATEPLAIILR